VFYRGSELILMRIGIFTPRSLHPLHPRLMLLAEFFRKKGLEPAFINQSNYAPNFFSRINWLTLWFMDMYAVNKCKRYVKDFDIVLVTDLKYLSLARYARRHGKIVVYDTVDHNVYLRFYQLEQKVKAIRLFKGMIIPWFKRVEKRYAFRYCDEIMVNSNALAAYFEGRAHTLYYCSPFEAIMTQNNPQRAPALIYLGIFSYEKGAREIMELQSRLSLPLFVYGNVSEIELKHKIENLDQVQYVPRINVEELEKHLVDLLNRYYLIGFSLIHAAHYSYEVQEANKDIDYLAMGIPIIGNHRLTTKEKIDAGCGIFFDDERLREKIHNQLHRKAWSAKAKAYYNEKYSFRLFYRKLEDIFGRYLR
jgi:hypothetical protein